MHGLLNLLNKNSNLSVTESSILSFIDTNSMKFSLFKDPKVVQKVIEVVPDSLIPHILEKVEIKLENEEDQIHAKRDNLLVTLLDWFKGLFFNWFNSPICDKCSLEMTLANIDFPTYEESKWLAGRVEVFQCNNCQSSFRFPRYNHPLKLLETRTGRCGEWSTCFTAICYNFHYDIRVINDFSDHVWNEVYSVHQKRWLHVDCCENAIDTPFIYEVGWKKNISYIMGFSEYECQDVTWRYTRKFNEILQIRRSLFREKWLINVILETNKRLQRNLSPDEQNRLMIRRMREFCELIWTPFANPSIKESDYKERTSGSLSWRLSRGETDEFVNGYIIKCHFKGDAIIFKCALDEYIIGNTKIKGWTSCVYSFKNIFKKRENDWKVTYLSRKENSNCSYFGKLVYKIKPPDSWNEIELMISSKTFENAQVKAEISLGEKTMTVETNLVNIIKKECFPITDSLLSLSLVLSGGESNIGWQQAQLFRQSFTDQKESLRIVFN